VTDEFGEAREEVEAFFARSRMYRELRWRDSIVPPRFTEATLADVPERWREPLTDWVAEQRRTNVIILGPVGVGKTHAAIAAARGRWTLDESVLFTTQMRMLNELRPPLSVPIDVFIEPDVLILDDLGRAKASEWTHEQVWFVLDERGTQMKPTIITTNADDLAHVLREASLSRLLDGALMIEMTGADRRLTRG
jgi:DNA replication protein DnaC